MRFDLPLFDDEPAASSTAPGGPIRVQIRDIDENPDQPRLEFDDEPLKELAATIAERGVRSPVSVRPHPKDRGRWMLNYGARRLRASKLAGLKDIPAFVDQAADSYDQVIENEQREGLKPLELALFVQRELKKGVSQAEIARRLGKSPTYITFVRAMIDPPAWLMDVYRAGKCRNAGQLYELRRIHEAAPEHIERQLAACERIGSVEIEQLKREGALEAPGAKRPSASRDRESDASRSSDQCGQADPPTMPGRPGPASILVLKAKCDGKEVRVHLGALPSGPMSVYVTSVAKPSLEPVHIRSLTDLQLTRQGS
jgi:ParB family transcriptional regulator, chromosome partitioning protein